MVIDEEQQANAMDSPFKSTITKLVYDVLTVCGISIKQVHDKTSRVCFNSIVKAGDYETMVRNTESRTTTPPSINTTIVPSTIYSNITITSSQMRIVSQINVNGVQRLAITDGNRFFFSK
ncbi:unnamed protein product [Rotaria sp. Silwood2]|nr:unnamed protein product [Rotaria sp. Silwood2]CAF3068511.1 unnamed protein product [Rotaria sp. Silwood2]CAF4063727.1 unnamed protein product [Rotaria sp. Silwood2]CAF4118261.1 unnamed protein product [Rotaria sp. Silwood2]